MASLNVGMIGYGFMGRARGNACRPVVPARPDLRTALQTRKVCDAVLASAASGRRERTGVSLQQ